MPPVAPKGKEKDLHNHEFRTHILNILPFRRKVHKFDFGAPHRKIESLVATIVCSSSYAKTVISFAERSTNE